MDETTGKTFRHQVRHSLSVNHIIVQQYCSMVATNRNESIHNLILQDV